MARLIDADALLVNVVAISNSKGQVTWSAVPTTDILTAPTVDAVEVVRCKDCKHWQKRHETMGLCLGHNSILTFTKQDFYCAYGERRTDG